MLEVDPRNYRSLSGERSKKMPRFFNVPNPFKPQTPAYTDGHADRDLASRVVIASDKRCCITGNSGIIACQLRRR